MKKNQNGVSMVSLVITIIVIIILAAVAFTGSQETISRAGFSGFVTDIDSVRTAFITEGVTNLRGQEQAKNNTITLAQAYNYLAKGGTQDSDWLTKAQAEAIQCTRISRTAAPNTIGITLPVRTVNTNKGTNIEMSYFVTNKGDIFVWPPYTKNDDGYFYVNDVTPVILSGETTPTKDETKIYPTSGTISFNVNGSPITVSTGSPAATLPAVSTLSTTASVYYTDGASATSPVGLQ